MNFKNKFDDAVKKYYRITYNSGETSVYNGSKHSHFERYDNIKLIMYAGKAIKALNYTIKNFVSELDEYIAASKTDDEYIGFLNTSIAGCKKAIDELKDKKEYDLVGIYKAYPSDDYFIVDYKEACRLASEANGITFEEISKLEYDTSLEIELKEDRIGLAEYYTNKEIERKQEQNEIIKAVSIVLIVETIAIAALYAVYTKFNYWYFVSLLNP